MRVAGKYQSNESTASQQYVTIKIFAILGNEIESLVNEIKPACTYEDTWHATNLQSGVYFYRLKVYPANSGAGNFIETKKMILLK